MLNVKKTLTKLLQNAVIKDLSFTRISNNYVNATDFGRINGKRIGNIGIINFNFCLSASLPNNTSVDFGQIDNVTLPNMFILGIPCQSNNSSVVLTIGNTGKMTINNWCGTATGSNWFRASIPIVISGGGYFLTRFMSTFSRLAERWWEYVERKENAYEDISNGSYCRHRLYQNRWNWDLLGSRNDGIKLCGNRNVPNRIQKHFVNLRICDFRIWQHTHIRRHISIGTNIINKLNVYLWKGRFVHNWRRLWNQLGCNRPDIATTSERGWAVC